MLTNEQSTGRAGTVRTGAILSTEGATKAFPVPSTFGEYHEQVLQGRNDPLNAADRVLRALINPARHRVEQSLNGPIYHVFDERTDGLEVFGMHEAKRALMDALTLSAQTGGAENIIMLVLPSGAGKSTMLEIIKRELIRDARENPLLTIDDCPTRETPDHLLTDSERQEIFAKTGRVVHGELCAHCQSKLEEQGGDRDKMAIRAVRVVENAGISELDPRLTKPGDWRTQEYLVDVALRAAGGMLRIPEFVKQGKVAHEGLMDFYRGVPERKVTDPRDGRIHRVDCLVVGDTTVQEFEAFFDSNSEYLESEAMQALKDRMLVVKAPHNLSASQEVRIYEKMLRVGNFLGQVHASPRLLETLAEIAVQTRLLDSSKFDTLTREAKVSLYEQDEGLVGISPPFVRREVLLPLFSAALKVGYDNPHTGTFERGCVTPLEAFRTIEQAINDAEYELGYVYGSDYEQIIAGVRTRYDKWLTETVIGAFNKRHREAIQVGFEEYVNAIDRLLSGDSEAQPDALDTSNQPLGVARRGAEALETKIFGHIPNPEETREFRLKVLTEMARRIEVHQAQGDPAFAQGTEVDIKLLVNDEQRGLETTRVVDAIREMITGARESGEDLLRTLLPGNTTEASQVERIEEARTNLIEDYGFCSCCADKLMEYAAGRLPKKPRGNGRRVGLWQ